MHSLIVTAVLLLLAFLCQQNEAMICYPCGTEEADVLCKASDTSNCRYGLVEAPCGCCDQCAKGPGELCGGGEYYMGTCGEGMYCKQPVLPPGLLSYNQPGTCSRSP